MEEPFEFPQHQHKLYKSRSIYIATFLGGPLVAGYMISENFKALGQSEKIRNTWLITIGVTIVIFSLMFFGSFMEKVPKYIIPILYAGATELLVSKYQGKAINEHIEKGGPIYSGWKVFLISIIGLLIFVAILLVPFLIFS